MVHIVTVLLLVAQFICVEPEETIRNYTKIFSASEILDLKHKQTKLQKYLNLPNTELYETMIYNQFGDIDRDYKMDGALMQDLFVPWQPVDYAIKQNKQATKQATLIKSQLI